MTPHVPSGVGWRTSCLPGAMGYWLVRQPSGPFFLTTLHEEGAQIRGTVALKINFEHDHVITCIYSLAQVIRARVVVLVGMKASVIESSINHSTRPYRLERGGLQQDHHSQTMQTQIVSIDICQPEQIEWQRKNAKLAATTFCTFMYKYWEEKLQMNTICRSANVRKSANLQYSQHAVVCRKKYPCADEE